MPDIIQQIITFLLILAGVYIAWHVVQWFLHTLTFTPDMFKTFVTSGQPTLVYFFNRNCPLCKHARKAAFYAVAHLDKEAQLLLINTGMRGGGDIAREYGVDEVPACLVFNETGIKTYTVTGLPDVDKLISELRRAKQNG